MKSSPLLEIIHFSPLRLFNRIPWLKGPLVLWWVWFICSAPLLSRYSLFSCHHIKCQWWFRASIRLERAGLLVIGSVYIFRHPRSRYLEFSLAKISKPSLFFLCSSVACLPATIRKASSGIKQIMLAYVASSIEIFLSRLTGPHSEQAFNTHACLPRLCLHSWGIARNLLLCFPPSIYPSRGAACLTLINASTRSLRFWESCIEISAIRAAPCVPAAPRHSWKTSKEIGDSYP